MKKRMFIASIEDWGLPNGYTKVEYIQSTTRKEWFDTGVYSKSNLQMQGKVYAAIPSDDKKFVYGGEGTFGTESTSFYLLKNFSWGIRLHRTDYEGYEYGGGTITFDINRNRAILNGTTVATYSCDNYETTQRTIYIFGTSSGLRTRSDKGDNGTMRLYWFKIYSDSTLVRDFIPCLDTSGTPCLFDRVGQTTYYNKGSGTLTYG